MTYSIRTATVAAIALVSSTAIAQPTYEKGKADDVKDVKAVEWTAKGEASLMTSTGNSRTTTASVGANATRKDKDNKFDAAFVAAYARATTRTATDTNGNGAIDAGELSTTKATSAKNMALKLRYDRYLSTLDALYVAALGAIDQPAGKEFQGGGQIGYSRGLYKSDCHEVLAEVGYDLSYLRLSAGSSATIHSGRAFVGYKGKLKEDTSLEASAEGLFNGNRVTFGAREAGAFGATRLNGMVGVTTALSTKLSLTASFTAKYDNFPAPLDKVGALPFAAGFAPSADKLDTVTKVSLIVKFL